MVAVILVGEPGRSDKAGSSCGRGRTWQDPGFVVKLEQQDFLGLGLGVGSGSQGCPGNCGWSPRGLGTPLALLLPPRCPELVRKQRHRPVHRVPRDLRGPREMGPPGL